MYLFCQRDCQAASGRKPGSLPEPGCCDRDSRKRHGRGGSGDPFQQNERAAFAQSLTSLCSQALTLSSPPDSSWLLPRFLVSSMVPDPVIALHPQPWMQLITLCSLVTSVSQLQDPALAGFLLLLHRCSSAP